MFNKSLRRLRLNFFQIFKLKSRQLLFMRTMLICFSTYLENLLHTNYEKFKCFEYPKKYGGNTLQKNKLLR